MTIGFDAIAGLMVPTAEKVANRWSSMTFVLNRIIQNWEKSGKDDCCHIDRSSDIEDFSQQTTGMTQAVGGL